MDEIKSFCCRLPCSYLQGRVSNAPVKLTGEMAFELSGGFISGETIVSNHTPVVLSSGLGGPGSVKLTEVDVEKASPNSVAIIPLKSINQRPDRVAKHTHTIKPDSCNRKSKKAESIFYMSI